MDIFDKKKRSEIMSRVKNKGSKIELSLMEGLNGAGFRYRKNVSKLPGNPDVAFTRKKIVIFVDSCFWHGCRWHGTIPASNKKFWNKKISTNKNRDKAINKAYRRMGWKVVRVWEHALKKDKRKTVEKIIWIIRNSKIAAQNGKIKTNSLWKKNEN